MNLTVFCHRNPIVAAVNTSEELLSVREDAVVGHVRTDEGRLNRCEGRTAPEQVEKEVQKCVAQIASHVSTCAENDSEMNCILSLRLFEVSSLTRIHSGLDIKNGGLPAH